MPFLSKAAYRISVSRNVLERVCGGCRCGMNPSSLYEMRHSIVQAVSDYVDIEAEELVEVRRSNLSPFLTYCANRPINLPFLRASEPPSLCTALAWSWKGRHMHTQCVPRGA